MVKNWEEIKNAIRNLKEVKKYKTKDIYNLPVSSLLKINGNYFIIEKKNPYEDWTEYKLKNILNNSKSYLEVEEERKTLWKRVNREEEIEILENFSRGKCNIVETGNTDEYRYYTVKCNRKLYSIEEYIEDDGTKEREVYIAQEVNELKLL